jgi:hypothetical protein
MYKYQVTVHGVFHEYSAILAILLVRQSICRRQSVSQSPIGLRIQGSLSIFCLQYIMKQFILYLESRERLR